jgi:hypothetical protein
LERTGGVNLNTAGSQNSADSQNDWRRSAEAQVGLEGFLAPNLKLKQSLATLGRATGKAFKSPSNLTTSFSSEISNFTLFEEVAITLCCRTVEIATVTSTVTVGPLPTEPVLLTN